MAARSLTAVGLQERFMRTMAAVHSDMTSGLMQRLSSLEPHIIEKKKSSLDESDNALSLPRRFLPLEQKDIFLRIKIIET